MARGTTLIRLLDMLRAEARLSKNPAHNVQVRDTHIDMLQRVQDRLWDDFAWPHLRVTRQIPAAAGQRYYSPPEDIAIDNVEAIEVFREGRWLSLAPGLSGSLTLTHNSDLGERGWPIARWQIHEGEQIEVWPIPDQNGDPATLDGFLRVRGIRNLRPLVKDSDRADLDDRLIVLYAAAELLAAAGTKDAQMKLEQANNIYSRLRSGFTPKKKVSMFGINSDPLPAKFAVGRYRPPGV